MPRYSQAFLIVALFCFLLPFGDLAPTHDSGSLRLTGWDMVSSQNIQVSKDPPLILNIPLRVEILIALSCAVAALLMKLSRRSNLAIAVALAATVAAVSLLTHISSGPGVQLTDGHNVQPLESAAVKLLPGFYCSLILMFAAAVASWMGLQRRATAQAGFRPAFTPVRVPGSASSLGLASGVAGHSFCIKCGDGLSPSARFCNRCGAAVPLVRPAAAAAVPKPPEIAVAAAETAGPVAIAPVAASLASAVAPVVAPAPPPSPPPAVAVVTNPPAIPRPAPAETTNAVAGSHAVVSTQPAPPPPPVPPRAPVRVEVPSIPLPRVPQPRFSAGAKLGLAAASVIVMAGVWLAFHSVGKTDPMSAPTAISIYPATVRVAPGGTVQLQAMVTGGINREVQWSIQEGMPGGSVEQAGATVQNGNVFLLASYKAPTMPGVYHVVAVSTADQSRKAVVQIYVSYGFPRF